MTKPREEEWIAGSPREDGTAQVYAPSLGPCRVVVPVAETTAENAALIAAAPDLYRALSELEWSGCDLAGEPRCPRCLFYPHDDHEGGCTLAAALRKARGET